MLGPYVLANLSKGDGNTQLLPLPPQNSLDLQINFGADNTGAKDVASILQNACNTAALTGVPLWIGPGTYKVASQITVPDGLNMNLSPLAVMVGTITGSQISGSSMFYAPVPSATGSTTLASTPSLYSPTVSATGNVGGTIKAGAYIQILSVSSPPTASIFYVESVSGSGPYTVTLDRPLLWSFSSGDTVNVLASRPVSVRVNGNGASITGKAAAFFAGCYWYSIKENIVFRNLDASSNNIDALAGFNYGSYASIMRNCRGDASGAGTAFNAGYGTDGEAIGLENCIIENGAPGNAASGIKYGDARGCWDLNCRASNVQVGLYLGSDSAPGVGSSFIRSMGGNYIGNSSHGVWVAVASTNNYFDGLTSCQNGGDGVRIDTGSNENQFGTIIANSNTGNGVTVIATAKGTYFASLVTNGNGSAGLAAADECIVGQHEALLNVGASTGNACIDASGSARVIVQSHKYSTVGSVYAVAAAGTARVDVRDGTIVLSTNAVGYASLGNGSTVFARNCVANILGGATGTIGFYSNTGGTIHIGPGCDGSATATPFSYTGYGNRKNTLSATGTSPVSVLYPRIKTTDLVQFTLQTPSGAVGTPRYTIQQGSGFTFTSTGPDSSVYEWFIP